ncbi:MAG: hypothetical protein AABX11_00710 [Nanoarchaeota archaeon]
MKNLKTYLAIGAVTLGLPIASELTGLSSILSESMLTEARIAQFAESKRLEVPNKYESHYNAHQGLYHANARIGVDLSIALLGFSILGTMIVKKAFNKIGANQPLERKQ